MIIDLHESLLKQYSSFRTISVSAHTCCVDAVDSELRMELHENVQGPIFQVVTFNTHLTIKRFIINGQ